MSSLAVRSTLVAAAAALAVGACGGGGSPQERLEEAASRTADSSFAYEFTIEADEEAVRSFGPEGQQAAGFLQSFAVAGQRAGETMELRVGVLGFDVLEVRSLGEHEVYLRLGIQDLAAVAGAQAGELSANVVPQLEQAGVPQEVVAAVEAALDGRWVGVEGEVDERALQEALGAPATTDPSEQAEHAKEALGGDIEGFVEQYVEVVDVREQDGNDVFDVNVRLRELLRSLASADPSGQVEDLEADLADLPEQVAGTVTVADDVIQRIAVDVAEAVREAGGQVQGSVELQLDLSDHGQLEEVVAPDDVTTITGDQLGEAIAALIQGMGGLPGVGGVTGQEAPSAPVGTESPTG